MSPPTMNVSSSSGYAHAAPAGYRPCTTARRAATSSSETAKRSSPATASSAQLQAHLARRGRRDLLVRRRGDRHQQDAVEPELVAGLLRADEMARGAAG